MAPRSTGGSYMAKFKVHGVARKFSEAARMLAEAKAEGLNAELWLTKEDKRGNRYAVISRQKRRGRNPEVKLLDRLDVLEHPSKQPPKDLPKEFKIVGRWVECLALNDRKTLLVRGEKLKLLPKR